MPTLDHSIFTSQMLFLMPSKRCQITEGNRMLICWFTNPSFNLKDADRQTNIRWQHLPCKHIHTHPFNGPLSGTTQVSQYQKGKTNLDFTGARDSERQWYQLGHMQVCTSLQTDNHASTSLLKFFTGRMPFLPPHQQCQSTEGIQCSKNC